MTARKGEAPFDWWSIPHFLAGAALALAGAPFSWALSIVIGYEILEAILRKVPAAKVILVKRFKGVGKGVFEYESWPNILADIALALSAFGLARWLAPGAQLI